MSTPAGATAPATTHPGARPVRALVVAFLVTVPAFAAASLAGGGPGDAGLVPIVRFMGATKLAAALSVALASMLRYDRPERRRRRAAGMLGAACMALGAGFVWSGAGFGAGFAAFAAGLCLAGLLAIKELEASLRRRP